MYLANLEQEDEDRLRELAVHDQRSFRDQGRYYLLLKIREEYAKLVASRGDAVGEVA